MRRILVAAMIALTAVAGAQEKKKQERRVAPVAAAAKSDKSEANALEFLKRVEEKHKDTKSVQAKFTQTRRDHLFDEEVKTEGEFWYQSPNRFHASYTGDNPSKIWLSDTEYIEYIPNLKQVDKFKITKSDSAPISQLLLGFGVKVDEITKLFDVTEGEATKDSERAIVFDSRDLDRTMNFHKVVVHFDKKSADPRRIVLEDDQSQITLAFTEIEVNPARLDAKVFEPKWPEDKSIEVVNHSAGSK